MTDDKFKNQKNIAKKINFSQFIEIQEFGILSFWNFSLNAYAFLRFFNLNF